MFKNSLLIAVFFFTINAYSQCAMCKAVVEGGNETVAEGVNNGITYLMIFPYILVGVLFYFIYKHKKRSKN
ncbi:hypothetical protein [Tenacibaculum aestuariivivum]|uniref:hypothetical protein n=1 Tax=Tenacibaculum aestuariivivum TaxID=2006131 RepID=UPI003AB5B939